MFSCLSDTIELNDIKYKSLYMIKLNEGIEGIELNYKI
jgi:hypothetical protein